MRFTDKVVVITGAAQGIGRQTAEQAAAEGAALLLIDRSSYVHELAATLAQSGCLVLALEADLEAWESTEQAFAAGVAHFGRIDVLINNVGGTIWARPFAEYQPEQIEKEIRRSLFPHAVGLPRGAAMDAEAGQRQHRQHFIGGDGGSESGAVLGGERRR
ncbi:1,2-dihydroxycyclohexa-3,5-diene-1-carboxylate dehydrogenase [Klebsiella pneumoniae subsp. pneumoniae]|nr:1,2-dihydroxycyclohexa-3,5-diene-1-carboxylate dehydrogenase [Klebsiella pneumoniae subsp. pneumoniae]